MTALRGLKAGPEGATVWRWELAADDLPDQPRASASIASREKLSARLDMLPKGPLLLRGDSVAFPPDGCAYLHRHQGPGIRCLLEGGIRIDTAGHSTSYGPGVRGTRVVPSRSLPKPRTGRRASSAS